jgi:adenylosuccinate lyase
LVVYAENMKRNLERSGSLFFSEAILLALIGKGLGRQEAYVLVQRNAMKAFQNEGPFRTLLGADADVAARLSAAELDECFDLEHSLRFAEQIVDRAIRA